MTDRQLDEAYLVNRIVDIYRKNRCVYGGAEDVACGAAGRTADRP